MKPLFIFLIACAITTPLSGQVSNDDCANAELISNISTRQSLVLDLTNATESLDASCEDANNNNLDRWYSFTMPFDGLVKISGLSTVNKTSLYATCGGTEIYCQSSSGYIPDLQGGTTYLLRYATASQYSGNNTLYIQAFPPPSNDECSAPIPIPDISNKQIVQVDNRGASESLETACDPSNQDNFDIWYSFTMPFNGNVKVSGTSGSQKLALFDTCGANELNCFTSNGYFLNLSAGNTYLIRFSSTSSSAVSTQMTIEAFAPPANDSCSSAITLGDISTPFIIDQDNRGASESLKASCESVNFEYLDLWYDFEMPFDGNVKVTGIFGVNRVALFDGCGGNELACNTGLAIWEQLDSGQVYLMRYSSLRSQALYDPITILATSIAKNDECVNAIFLDSLEYERTVSLDTRSATESLDASCESAAENNLDLWYSFTMPFFGNVKITGVFGVNRITLFDACGGTELVCSQSGAFFENLTGGQSYILRYSAISQQSNVDQFTIKAVPTGLNDDCVDAFLITNIDQEQNISLDTRSASESLNSSCEVDTDDNLDLWYSFTMPFGGMLKVSGVFGVNKLAIYDGCDGNELACFASNGVFYNLDSGQHYVLRYATTRQMANVDDFRVQAFRNLSYDLCGNALLLEKPDSAQWIVADTREASQSVIASCEDSTFAQQDLWYRIRMPFDGKVFIRDGNNAHNFSLWDACEGNEILCFSGFGEFSGLTDSTEYWLRYASPSVSAVLDSFELEAVMSVGIEELSDFSLRLYPNPVKDRLVVEWEGRRVGEVEISIFDLSGRNFFENKISSLILIDQKWELHLPNIPKGLYLLRIKIGGEMYPIKFLKD